MHERHLPVTRTARYHVLGDPSPAVTDLWIVCHGYGQLAARFLEEFGPIAGRDRLIVAPEGLSRFYTNHAERQVGASWMTREDRLREIDDYVAYLDALHAHLSSQLVGPSDRTVRLLGFSQGVHTVCRWVGLGTVAPEQLILWGSPAPPDLDLALLRGKVGTPPLLVVGGRDEYVTDGVVAAETARFAAAGLELAVRRFDGGHRLDDTTLRAVAAAVPSIRRKP